MATQAQITKEIQAKSKEMLGVEISQTELRLMAYIHFVMANEQRIEPNKINGEERKILSSWRTAGWVEGGVSGLAITEEFWNCMCAVLWLGYVAHDAQGDEKAA